MSTEAPKGEAGMMIEFDGPNGRLRLSAHHLEWPPRPRNATTEDLAAAGFVPASQLHAMREEMEQWALSLRGLINGIEVYQGRRSTRNRDAMFRAAVAARIVCGPEAQPRPTSAPAEQDPSQSAGQGREECASCGAAMTLRADGLSMFTLDDDTDVPVCRECWNDGPNNNEWERRHHDRIAKRRVSPPEPEQPALRKCGYNQGDEVWCGLERGHAGDCRQDIGREQTAEVKCTCHHGPERAGQRHADWCPRYPRPAPPPTPSQPAEQGLEARLIAALRKVAKPDIYGNVLNGSILAEKLADELESDTTGEKRG